MLEQPRGVIWVPIGREGVVVEVFVTWIGLVARAVAVTLPIDGSGGNEEMFKDKRGRPEIENGGAVPVGRTGSREVEFKVGNGTRTEGLVAFSV